ncbi:MAG: hypothetical protein NZ840_05510 [Anaerolineales bacterium]|nr:hypothetical protein [Anaerolineales bacterium]MDW8161494.1 hypothetical protein [Anaerolineales bacterium]
MADSWAERGRWKDREEGKPTRCFHPEGWTAKSGVRGMAVAVGRAFASCMDYTVNWV